MNTNENLYRILLVCYNYQFFKGRTDYKYSNPEPTSTELVPLQLS